MHDICDTLYMFRYMNVKQESWPKVLPFLEFGFDTIGQNIIMSEVGYVNLNEGAMEQMMLRFNGSDQYSNYGEGDATVEDPEDDVDIGLIIGLIISILVIIILIVIVIWYGRKYKEGHYVFNENNVASPNNNGQSETEMAQK